MARKPSKTLTGRELEIMQVIWALGEARLGEIQDALNRHGEPVAASTVATQLNLLVHKGYLTQAGRHGRSVYAPTCTREEATKNLFDDFLARVGLGHRPAFLIQMLKNERLSAEDRAALEEILRESRPEPPRKSRPRIAPPPPEEP
jgi:predicted transcriptional regulator